MANNTELNDIFVEENAAANAGDGEGFVIDVVNTANNASAKYTIFPESTLGDVLHNCSDIALSENDAAHCVFECDGKTTSRLDMNCADFGLVAGGKLLINPSGKVA